MSIEQYTRSKQNQHAYSPATLLPSAKIYYPTWGFYSSSKSRLALPQIQEPKEQKGKELTARVQSLTSSAFSAGSSSSSSSSSTTTTTVSRAARRFLSAGRLEEARSKEKAANKTYNQELALAKSHPRMFDQAKGRREAIDRFNETMDKLEAEYSDVGFTREV